MTAAQNDNYYSFDKQLDLSQGGIVYPFTGIRGEAKELYLKIKNGQKVSSGEVELVRADTHEEQRLALANADFVIMACGYMSN